MGSPAIDVGAARQEHAQDDAQERVHVLDQRLHLARERHQRRHVQPRAATTSPAIPTRTARRTCCRGRAATRSSARRATRACSATTTSAAGASRSTRTTSTSTRATRCARRAAGRRRRLLRLGADERGRRDRGGLHDGRRADDERRQELHPDPPRPAGRRRTTRARTATPVTTYAVYMHGLNKGVRDVFAAKGVAAAEHHRHDGRAGRPDHVRRQHRQQPLQPRPHPGDGRDGDAARRCSCRAWAARSRSSSRTVASRARASG